MEESTRASEEPYGLPTTWKQPDMQLYGTKASKVSQLREAQSQEQGRMEQSSIYA
jgi:hypothetical protein